MCRLKLIALKKISVKLPKDAIFEQPDRQAKILIALKVARAVDATDSADVKSSRPRRNSYRRSDLTAED